MEENNNKILRTRKEWKSAARKVVRSHYLLLVMLVLVSVFYCTEFGYITARTEELYDVVKGNKTLEEVLPISLDYSAEETPEEEVPDNFGDLVISLLPEDEEEPEGESALQQSIRENITQRDHGIFASVANTVSSGKVQAVIVKSINSMVRSEDTSTTILVLLTMLVSILIYVFVKRLYMSMMRRMFLEARLYKSVPVSHLLYFKFVGRWIRASLTLLLRDIFMFLWSITIVGGIIKHFSYFLVPYIVAENPDIKPREAVTLSRRMMDGHKWEAFKLELSFLGWDILGVFTFGISETLWSLPYSLATYTEYYVARRAEAKSNGIEGSEMLNDTYLYVHPDQEAMASYYGDIEEDEEYVEKNEVVLSPACRFMADNFGLWIGSPSSKKAYDDADGLRKKIAVESAILDGEIYPLRMSPLWKPESTGKVRKISYLRTYSVVSVIMIFFVFALVGWMWEVGIHLVNDGVFVNRGCMHGPWLPIYGGGVAMILVLLARWRNRKYVEAAAIVVLCGMVEYFTSYFLEISKGLRWWDYTGYFLNLNGRICGEGLMVFAIGGMAAVYLLAPVIDSMLSKVNRKFLTALSIVLVLCFAADVVYSHYVPNTGEGITDYEAYTQTGMYEIVVDSDTPPEGGINI